MMFTGCCATAVPHDRSVAFTVAPTWQVEILKVHDDFYVALKSGDAPLMRTLWEVLQCGKLYTSSHLGCSPVGSKTTSLQTSTPLHFCRLL